jgi:DNA-binding NarL/FixJ family response regulator
VIASDEFDRARLLALIGTCGFPLAADPGGLPGVVVIVAAPTVDEAIAAWPARRTPSGRWLIVAEKFSLPEVIRAVQAGVHAMLRARDVTSPQLAAAVPAARRGDDRLPPEVLSLVCSSAALSAYVLSPSTIAASHPLVSRGRALLALMAEGLQNADIAQVLCWSEHTVKNVIYDLTARLQVRNRAHAVACAVRGGII